MIEIVNENLFAKVIADSLSVVDKNTGTNTWEKIRLVNAIAKAAAKLQSRWEFITYDAAENNLLIWSDSNEIYEITADGRCQCFAQANGFICWHRVAKRLLELYFAALGEPGPHPRIELSIPDMPYLPNTRRKAIETVGGIRIS